MDYLILFMFYILSLGGSIISLSDGLNSKFLKKFKKLIEKRVEQGDRFIIVVGGGFIARKYVQGLNILNKDIKTENKDYLGIYATYINAWFVRSIFEDLSYEKLITNPNIKIRTNKPLIFSGGYKPGNSSDLVAVLLAETYNVKNIINLSNIDYVYDNDPKKFPDAKKIEKINWKNFLELIGNDFKPGMNAPFDPIASKFCQKKGKKVIVLNGQNIKNLENYFLGQKFKGTEISN